MENDNSLLAHLKQPLKAPVSAFHGTLGFSFARHWERIGTSLPRSSTRPFDVDQQFMESVGQVAS